MMSRFLSSVPFVFILAVFLTFTVSPVYAQQEIVKAIHSSTEQLKSSEGVLNQQLIDAIEKVNTDVSNALLDIRKDEVAEKMASNPLQDISYALASYQTGQLVSKAAFLTTEYNVLHILERMEKTERADYEIDSSLTEDVASQAFHIFMRYFCDPESRSGTQEGKTYPFDNFNVGGTVRTFEVGCGTATGGVPSRASMIGADPNTPEARQLIGLPVNASLFFGHETFPSLSAQAPSASGPSNTNRAVSVYEGAFHLAMMFLIGDPPGKVEISSANPAENSAFLAGRAQVARQMLASYPLTLLFSERLGTIEVGAKDAIVNLFVDKLGIVSENPHMLDRIENLRRRDFLSVAEYENILYDGIISSPGYYARINSEELTPSQLKRESLWLTSMLVSLNYKRNKWLEIQAALEAVNGAQ